MQSFIPNSASWITDREIEAVVHSLRNAKVSSNHENLRPTQEALMRFTDGHPALLTTSCTSAMELALLCCNLQPQEQVILPSFTFVSTANAVLQAGGRPVFIDIEEDTLNIDLPQLSSYTDPLIRGIMPVHYGGISCDMDHLLALAKERGWFTVEDAAHAIGARYKGRPLGTLGHFGCLSFHDTKNIVAGEGGALVINDKELLHAAEWAYEKGTNRSQFLRGEIDKYSWVSLGGSFVMSAILAALLRVQLERYDQIFAARKQIVELYREGLADLVAEGHIRFTREPDYALPNYHLAFFLVNDAARRNPLLRHLKDRGVGALFHYIPLHLSPFGQKELGGKPGQFPVTERVAESIVRLPLFPHLPLEDCQYVIEQVRSFFHPTAQSGGIQAAPQVQKVAHQSLDLSLIIACYNEEPHLHTSLDDILGILDKTSLRYELIIIDDRSADQTPERIREYVSLHPQHRIRTVFHSQNVGRGGTVTEGIRMAHGSIVGFIDIDLEIHARYIPSAIAPLQKGLADIVVADRKYSFHLFRLQRYFMSLGYRTLVNKILDIPMTDTEAGFKFFRRDRILPVLDTVVDPHWFWDTEVTVRSLDAGLRLHNEPVLFQRKREKQSTVKIFSDSYKSLVALLAFRRRKKTTIHPHHD